MKKLKFSYHLLTLVPAESRTKSWSTKHFGSFISKQRCSILLKDWGRWGLVLICKKTQWKKKKNNIAPHSLSAVIQVSGSTRSTNWLEKSLTGIIGWYLPITVISVLLSKPWITQDELHGAILCCFLKTFCFAVSRKWLNFHFFCVWTAPLCFPT